MVLDEPTSFMDSWAEIDWFERLRTLANDRTTVIITHRLTIARHADVIHVMDKGQMIESGAHDELIALNGRYAASWRQQIEEKPGAIDRVSQNGIQNRAMTVEGQLEA
jgi:ATP-binding cassette subfamily B protein